MKILIVNAMGYGNIGDDTYPIVFKKYLKKHELHFANSDPTPIPKNLDLIILGGGGLIFDKEGEMHLTYIARYMKHALKNKIPYCFVSVGIQCRRDYKNNKWTHDQYARNWVPYLEKAAFASFRDVESARYFREKLSKTNSKCKIYVAPDMCYLYDWHVYKNSEKKYITIIPCATVKISFPKIKELVDEALEKHPDATLVAMNMGGSNTDKFSTEVAKCYPDKKVKVLYSRNIVPKRAINIINNSHKVFTGRYHGLVFSRITGTKYVTAEKAQYKIMVENRNSNIKDAFKHIKILKEYIRSINK